ncbi:MAG: hypothetical protein L6461_07585 [Anaerolineae bacterium]|nr:hypothetical protein [Anaerolineae bacterium]
MPVVTNAEHDIACSCSYKKRNTVLRIVTGAGINSSYCEPGALLPDEAFTYHVEIAAPQKSCGSQ